MARLKRDSVRAGLCVVSYSVLLNSRISARGRPEHPDLLQWAAGWGKVLKNRTLSDPNMTEAL